MRQTMRQNLWAATAFLVVITATATGAALAAQFMSAEADVGGNGSLPPSVPRSGHSEPPWSGKSGASGDPSMTAAAIRAAAADFPACLARLWPAAERRGVNRTLYRRYTRSLTPDLRIMDLLDDQPEFTKPIWSYLDLLVTDKRIAKGRALIAKYRPIFEAVQRAYGVDPYTITAIWGVETDYGKYDGDRSVLRSTATLACIGRRQHYFRREFLATMQILQHGDVPADRLVGSWAGAFGPTQFMPTAFLRYAVDFDHDGRRDVVDSVPDIIASTANNLKRDGWASGRTWGYEVTLPADFNFVLADRRKVRTIRAWQRLGVARPTGKPFPRPGDRAFLLLPVGIHGPSFLMLHNFRVLMRYNPAEAYALAIGYLADRLRGGGPFVQSWPRYERVLSRAQRLELQQLLNAHGFEAGEPDGLYGPRTRAAVRRFQLDIGRVPDGFATASLLDRLRAFR